MLGGMLRTANGRGMYLRCLIASAFVFLFANNAIVLVPLSDYLTRTYSHITTLPLPLLLLSFHPYHIYTTSPNSASLIIHHVPTPNRHLRLLLHQRQNLHPLLALQPLRQVQRTKSRQHDRWPAVSDPRLGHGADGFRVEG